MSGWRLAAAVFVGGAVFGPLVLAAAVGGVLMLLR